MPEFLLSDIIRKCDALNVINVLVVGHELPDGDAIGSVMGLSHYLQANHPALYVTPYISNSYRDGLDVLLKKEKTFHPFSVPEFITNDEPYITIVCDTATKPRVFGSEFLDNAEYVFVIDHHKSNTLYGDENCVLEKEACAEVITELIQKDCNAQPSSIIPQLTADFLYMGIVSDTGQFTRIDDATFDDAKFLLLHNASHDVIFKALNSETLESLNKKYELMHKVRIHDNIGYIYLSNKELHDGGYTYDEIHSVVNIMRECSDIDIAFTMHEIEPGTWKISLRTDGKTVDASDVLSNFGGGGHKGAAGLKITTDEPQKLKDDIFNAITAANDVSKLLEKS